MKNLLRISIVAYIHLIFNAQDIELTLSSVGYSLIAYTFIFNTAKAMYNASGGKTHTDIKREVLGV